MIGNQHHIADLELRIQAAVALQTIRTLMPSAFMTRTGNVTAPSNSPRRNGIVPACNDFLAAQAAKINRPACPSTVETAKYGICS